MAEFGVVIVGEGRFADDLAPLCDGELAGDQGRGVLVYGFIILRHDRRRIVHTDVTKHPTAIWIA